MKKNSIFIILLIIIAIAGVASLAFLNTSSIDNTHTNKHINNNSTNISHNNQNNSHNNKVGEGNVIATQEGPSSASYDTEVSIKWTVTNKGSSPITNAVGTSQFGNYNFGTINPGESKSTNINLFIPNPSYIDGNNSDPVVLEDYYVGGFSLEYKFNGKIHQMNSNSISIAIN